MGLQKFKMSIANTVINQENTSLQSMGTDQLLNLFTLDKVSRDDPTSSKHRTDAANQSIFICVAHFCNRG